VTFVIFEIMGSNLGKYSASNIQRFCRSERQCWVTKLKICSYCAEEIQDDAIKCKHCGEFLAASHHPRFAEEKIQWYFRKPVIIIAVCCVGPLALPLIWWRPQTTRAWKIGLTIGIFVLSWILFQATMESIRTLREYYKLIE
jgi:hypothetical protein